MGGAVALGRRQKKGRVSNMEKKSMKIRWINGACYEIALPDGTTIVTDPYVTPAGLERFSVDDFEGADYILVSHTHYDHTSDIGYLAEKFHSKIFIGEMSLRPLEHFFDNDYVQYYPISNEEVYELGEFTMRTIRSKHTALPEGRKATAGSAKAGAERKGILLQGDADECGWVELYDFMITLKDNFRFCIVAGVPFNRRNIAQIREYAPNLVIRQTLGTEEEYARMLAQLDAPLAFPNHHENPQRRFGMPMEQYVERINGLLQDMGSQTVLIDPVPYQWYELGVTCTNISTL